MEELKKELQNLQTEIEKIKRRNKRVETDKAWETSLTRSVFIALSTYIMIFVLMLLINADRPHLNALIPVIAYFISSATYGIIKKRWIEKNITK